MASPYTRATDLHRETATGADADRARPGPRRVARRPRSATDGLTTGRTHRRPLPADLLAQASRRLEAIALLAAALWIVSTIMGDHVDGRADLYALGCVAYFLLTRQLVFEADNALQSITKRLHETPVPPSQRTELPVPPDLDALVLACLAAQPPDRPATAGEVARRLAALSLRRWTDEEAARFWAARFPPAAGRPNNALVPSGRAAPSGRA